MIVTPPTVSGARRGRHTASCWRRPAGGWAFRRLRIAITLAMLANAWPAAADDRPPNILFIFSDDHACQAVGAYGSQINRTPNLDRLAREGMRFDRCLVTNSICGPSRAVILTGKYSHLNGFRQNGDRFDGSQPTFIKRLSAAGYQTAIIGKWHLESEPTGFDHWSILNDQGQYYNPDFITSAGTQRAEGYATELITQQAIDWLRGQRDPQRPFMLMVQHKAPHREWMPGPSELGEYRGARLPEPETLFDDYAGRPAVVSDQEMTIARHMRMGFDLKFWSDSPEDDNAETQFFRRLTPEQRAAWEEAYRRENEQFARANLTGRERVRWMYQRYLQDYLRCVAGVDASVGQLLDELRRSGLDRSTVVVYSSDQGFFLGEHGWYDKRWIFEPSLRTPLIVRWPGVTRSGSSNGQIVSNLDFAPTFLEIGNVQPPSEMQGRSLVPLLRGERPADWRQSFYYHYYETTVHHVPAHVGLVTDRYKLVCYYRTRKGDDERAINDWELLDRWANPSETRSYLGDPRYESVVRQLYDQLETAHAALADDRPLPELPPSPAADLDER